MRGKVVMSNGERKGGTHESQDPIPLESPCRAEILSFKIVWRLMKSVGTLFQPTTLPNPSKSILTLQNSNVLSFIWGEKMGTVNPQYHFL